MKNTHRDIHDILHFRSDISPFLVHLTRQNGSTTAKINLCNILDDGLLKPGGTAFCDAKFCITLTRIKEIPEEEQKNFFSAICFSETPLNEIHCLLDIKKRQINLEPYGIVFQKDRLTTKKVSPVFYLNNLDGECDELFYSIGDLIDKDTNLARFLFPLISVFGKKITPRGNKTRPEGDVDFRWEREWRRPAIHGSMSFCIDDVFIGLCPHEEIDDFESKYKQLKFVDPRRNMRWYSDKLITERQRLNLKFSVV